jgi:hypothetical protein
MPFSALQLSGATVGITALAFVLATPASAQEHYAHKHYAHTHYAHARYRHHYEKGRQIVVHPQEPVQIQAQSAWGPAAAVGNVVVGTGQAVQGVFTGAGAVVGGILGGVFGGAAALFGYPYNPTPSYAYGAAPSYAYGAPFAAPFNAAGAVAASPFQVVGGAFGGTPAVHPGYETLPAMPWRTGG